MRNVWNRFWQPTPGTGGKHEALPDLIDLNAQEARVHYGESEANRRPATG